MKNPDKLVHMNKKICQSTKLKEDSLVGFCGVSEKSSNQRYATILHCINLGDQRPRIFEKITILPKNLKFYRCIF